MPAPRGGGVGQMRSWAVGGAKWLRGVHVGGASELIPTGGSLRGRRAPSVRAGARAEDPPDWACSQFRRSSLQLHRSLSRRILVAIAADDFATWYRSLGDAESKDVRSERDRTAVESWFRELHDSEGPVPKGLVFARFRQVMLDLATTSVEKVLEDVERTTHIRPTVTVDAPDDTLRIEYHSNEDGSSGCTMPSLFAFDTAEALAEVADCLQEYVMEDLFGAWPTCSEHDLGGVHPEVRLGMAVWWCRTGDHSVASIGSLGLGDVGQPSK